ncbi:MAG: Rnase Y domain-containing protein, partial [Sedimentisphaerales bacterium]
MEAILMQINVESILAVIAGILVGVSITWIVVWVINKAKNKTFHEDIERQLDGAKKEAENIIRSAQIEAAAETIKKKEQFTGEANQIRAELRETELRLTKREDTLDKQVEQIRQKEKTIEEQNKEAERRISNLDLKDKHLTAVIAQQKNQLLKMSTMSVEEAKEMLLKRLEDECELEMSALIQRKVEEATETAGDKSREIITTAIQRYVAEQTCEVTVST